MADKTDENGVLLSDSKRLTPIGMAVRKSSLDELPQLINVLKGEMSLVGPRPLLYKYIPLHSQDQLKRYDIKPGITGWAQIKGRNAISWAQKFDLDIEYVENMSFLFDVKIFLMTLKKVVNRDDIYQKGNNIVPPFNGKN